MSKAELRRRVRDALRAVPDDVRAAEADDVVRRVAALLPVGPVLAYVPLPDEVDVAPLLAELAATGRLALPRVHGETLVAHWVVDPGALPGRALGVPEPHADGDVAPPATLAAVIVPARAYDRRGGRLGRGKGFYDRFLPLAPDALRIGVAHAVQVVDELPTDDHDAPVDVLVLPGEVVVTGARGWTP